MKNGIQLTAIFIANGMALLLAAQLLLGNNWRYTKKNKEYKTLRYLIYMSAIACMIDVLVVVADGRQGLLCWSIVYIGNMLLFIEDILVGIGWIVLICGHLNGFIPKYQKRMISALFGIGMMAIIVNLFVPVVFFVDQNNVYHREILFWMFAFIEGVFLADGIIVYLHTKKKGIAFRFFPVLQFVLPIALGIAVQGMFYGISTVYPAAIISFVGLFNSLRNEALFIDSLTGLYNRSFMDEFNDKITKKGFDYSITALMVDANNFKPINDQYGHAEGDMALKKIAFILKNTVGSLGCIIRYAGDEFIILLNTKQDTVVQECIQSIHKAFQEENKISGKEYELSVSIGYCSLSEQNSTIDDILNKADRVMYEEKKKYYSDPKKNRRKDWM